MSDKPKTIAEMAREAAERSRLEQGLPTFIEDPDVLDRIAALATMPVHRPER